MTSRNQAPRPPVLRCPSCGAELGTEPPERCASCGVPVGGETGRQLLALDQRMATLAAQRTDLLARLRREAAATPAVPPSPPRPSLLPPSPPPPAPAPRPSGGGEPGPVRRWLAAAGPQTLLAAGGVLLLAIAAIVFTAVTWRDLPMLARAGVLLAAAAGSGRLTAVLARRGLQRTAEATGVLTIALLAVLCNGLWAGGLLDAVGPGVAVLTVSSAVLAVASHLLARGTGARSPLVLAAWLIGTAVHAAGVWLTDPYATFGGDELDVLGLLAVDLVAALLAGGYAVRFLAAVPHWRVATLTGAGALWLVTAIGAPVILAALAPGTPPDVVPFGVAVVVVVATVALAAAARGITGPLASWWPAVGTSGMWFSATLGVTGALWNRLGVWPDIAVVVALTAGAAALTRCRTASRRLSALLGMTPVMLLAVVPVLSTAAWALAVLTGTATAEPDVTRLASVVIVAAVAAGLAVAVEPARPLLLGGGGMAWLVAVVAMGAGAGVLAPSNNGQLPAYLAHAVLLAVLAALAVRPALAPRPVAAGALSFAVTIGAAGLLWDRLAAWPQLPVVVPLAIGAVLVWRTRTADRLGALLGLAPIGAAATAPIAAAVVWIGAVLDERLATPWPPAPGTVAVSQPDAATLVSAATVCAIAVWLATVVHRTDVAAVLLVAVGGPVLLAVGAVVWPVGGAAVAGLVLVAGGIAGIRALPERPGPLALAAVATAITVIAALTAPWVTIATLALVAAVTALAVPVRAPYAATTVAVLLTADVVGLAAAVAAAASGRDPGPVATAIVAAAAAGWLVAAAVRAHRFHAAAVEVTAAVAFAIGVQLAGARGGVWLGTAFAVLATAAAAVAVWRPDRPWMQWIAAASASASSWSILADAGVETVEAYTAPPALLIVGLAALRLRARPDVSSWPILGPGLSLLTLPTVWQLIDDPDDLARLAVAVVLGVVLAVTGRTWAMQSPLVIGVAVCAVVALTQHAVVTGVLPRWLLLAAGGAVLLWLSITYEAQRRRLAVARRHLVAMR